MKRAISGLGALAVSALFIAATLSIANAADMTVKAPPPAPAPVNNWTGFYIGVNGGGVWGRTDPGYVNNTGFVSSIANQLQQAEGPNFNNSGGLAGGQIGYLAEFGKLVMGLEASFDWMKADGSNGTTASYVSFPAITYSFTEKVSSNWLALFTARVGWNMGNWYPYITGGLAVADFKYASSYSDNNGPGWFGAGSFEQVKTGPTVGGGLEWRFDNHWSLRGEYLYVSFSRLSNGTYSIFNTAFAPPNGGSFGFSPKFSESIARAALSYKF
jgi:outer membrane immunogenic protein